MQDFCQDFYMDLSKLWHEFIKTVTGICSSRTWICQNEIMKLSLLLHWFVKIDSWLCQSWYIDIVYLALYQTKRAWSLPKISVEASANSFLLSVWQQFLLLGAVFCRRTVVPLLRHGNFSRNICLTTLKSVLDVLWIFDFDLNQVMGGVDLAEQFTAHIALTRWQKTLTCEIFLWNPELSIWWLQQRESCETDVLWTSPPSW